MKKSLFALAFLASTLSGAASFGQTDETRIRSDAGGLYQSPAFGNGSVTGLPSTKVIFRDAAGKVLDERTVQAWSELVVAGIVPHPIESTIQHASGQKTLRFKYSALSSSHWFPSLPGGTVELVHNGVLVDRDRLYR
ncbi:MAG: hypothetical protein J0M26_19115 [Planctomycetes bacterium]|nr:hypothetical protein [Planctomycetota bacterium]